ALGRPRNRRQRCRWLAPIAIAAIGGEEEHPVLPDRTAQRAAVLVLIVISFHRREEGSRVERLVAEVLRRAAVNRIRPRLDDEICGALTVERYGGAAGLDLKLIDRVHGNAELQVASFAL